MYLSNSKSNIKFSFRPILILETSSCTFITSVTASVNSSPFMFIVFIIAFEFLDVSTFAAKYVVGSYSCVSYSNKTIYESFSMLLNIYSPLLFVIVSTIFPLSSIR